jgi:hypothetical protein
MQGNPYPPGLEPVVLDMRRPPGRPWSSVWPRPFEDPMPPADFSGLVTTEHYLYERFEPGEPRFKLRLCPRGPGETEAQYEAYRRGLEFHYRCHAIYLGLCQELCTVLGNHLHCAERRCRRESCCRGRRDEDYFAISLAIFPPCVALDIEIVETYRQEIIAELRRIAAQDEPEAE